MNANLLPKKKAVIIGINYIETEGISLRGCANDAKLMALTLISHFDFNPSDILFLTDSEPDEGYDMLLNSNETATFYDNWPRDEIPPAKHHDSRIYPNKRNILTAINWLTRDAEPGDILVFYFAGHGVQVDVLTSYEGDGYDEALLPADSTLYLASNGSDLDEYNVLLCSELKELLLCVPQDTQVNIILDCNGGQTILDPAGNINGLWYIKGIVTKGIWPFLSATNKVKRAQYKTSVFREERMVHRLVRPRYVPCVQISNTQNLKDPSLQSTQYVSLSCKGYCFSAAPWGEIAAEASLPLLSVSRKTQVTGIIDKKEAETSILGESKLGVIEIPISRGGAYNVIHGVFTWSFCKAISDIATGVLQQGRSRNELSYKTIMARIREYLKCLKSSILPHLDQIPEITIHSGGAGTASEYFCTPFGGDKTVGFDYDYYFMATDNCLSQLKKSQSFLIPQEAYGIMLKSSKIDLGNPPHSRNLINENFFNSVKTLISKSKTPMGNSPTVRNSSINDKTGSDDKFSKSNNVNNNTHASTEGNNVSHDQIITMGNSDGDSKSEIHLDNTHIHEKELPLSSVNLVPPTASIFNLNSCSDLTMNNNFVPFQLQSNSLNSFALNENQMEIYYQKNLEQNSLLTNKDSNYVDCQVGQFLNNFNSFQNISNVAGNRNHTNFFTSNPVLKLNPGVMANQGKQVSQPVPPQQMPHAVAINSNYLNTNRNSAIRNVCNSNFGDFITYPPVLSHHSILNKHLVVPANSLPNSNASLNSNKLYHNAETRYVTEQNSNSYLYSGYSHYNPHQGNQNINFQPYENKYPKYIDHQNYLISDPKQYPPLYNHNGALLNYGNHFSINNNNGTPFPSNEHSVNRFYPSSFMNRN